MKRFCYKCGALEDDAGPLIEGLCQRCFSEAPLLQVPNKVEVIICKRCEAYGIGKKWHASASTDKVASAVRETIFDSLRILRLTESGTKPLRLSEVGDVRVSVDPDLENSSASVRAVGRVHPLQIRPKLDEISVSFTIKYSTCEACGLKRARHHDAILQVRGKLSKDESSRVRKALESIATEASAREPKDFIADVKVQRWGLDMYLSSLSLARKMASLLRDEFGADISESAKLIGQTQDCRKKYRVSILARIGKKGQF